MIHRSCHFAVVLLAAWLVIYGVAACNAMAQASPAQQAKLQEAQQIMNEADQLYQQAKYREVIPMMERIVAIFREVYGPRQVETANALNNLAVAHWKLGHNQQARKLLEEVLEIQRAVASPDDFRISATLTNLGNVAEAEGNLAAAMKFTEQALELELKYRGANQAQSATALNRMGSLLKLQYRNAEARSYMERALAIRRRLYGEIHRDTAESLNNIGTLLSDAGDEAAAKPYFEQALAIYRRVLGPRHPHIATLYINMANQMAAMNDWGSARNFYLPALDIYRETYGEDNPNTAFVVHKIGATYANTGEHAEARKYYERSLAAYRAAEGEKAKTTAGVLISLGELHAKDREYDAAQKYFDQALAIYRSEESSEPRSVATTLNHLASMHADLNHFDQAHSLYKEVLEGYRAVLGENHPYVASTYDNIGDLFAKQGKWKEAADNIDQGRRIARRHAAKSLGGLSEREQLFYLYKESVGQLHAGLTFCSQRPEDQHLVDLAAGWLLNNKGQLQETLAERALLARDSRDPQLAAIVEQLTQVRQRMASVSFAGAASASAETQQLLEQLRAEEDSLSRRLSQAGGSASAERWVETSAVRGQVPAGAVFVDIARFKVFAQEVAAGQSHWKAARYGAWISPPAGSGAVVFVDLGDAKTVGAAVAAARKAIEDEDAIERDGESKAEKTAHAALDELSRRILAPIVSRLPADTSRLILSPDSSLWLVPWSALPLADGRYAVEQYEFQYVVSGRDLVAPRAAAAKVSKPVIMADPAFDLTPREAADATQAVLRKQADAASQLASRSVGRDSVIPKVARLPGTATEAAAIAPRLAIYADDEPLKYTGKYALEGVFKKLAHPKALVMSTHGFFLNDQQTTAADDSEQQSSAATDDDGKALENPLLRCGLLLAGCNARDQAGKGDDGILTGLEILSADLRGTDLVVLSACETGLGAVNNGEGVAGLRQAFQLAGASSVVATLWQIPDRDTALLMTDFFNGLSSGESKSASLRKAQLARIAARRQQGDAAHPCFWAAFTLTGM